MHYCSDTYQTTCTAPLLQTTATVDCYWILQVAPQPAMFTASPEQGEGDFTLTSLLRTAESTGYAFHTQQPEQLTVKLFDFQRSTYQVSATIVIQC
jgi:hypothetical protein